MSGANFFAALDDSGDEEKPVVEQKKQPKKSNKPVVEPSKVDRGRRPNQNDRNTKYGRGGRAPARDGKRAYDRRSGTGRGREIKKEGGGARNWGSNKNDARAAEGQVQEGAVEVVAMEENNEGEKKEEENGKTEENAEEVAAPPEEEADKTMSYEEYMATKEAPQSDAFAPVKQREVKNEFAGIQSKKYEEENFVVMGGGKNKRSKQKKDQKQTLVPSFRVADDRRREGRGGGRGRGRGRGDRGGRGGGRGDRGGGRGGGRGRGRGRESKEINVLDKAAFPSLG